MGEMKRAFFVTFIIFILLHFEAQAQGYSILTGIVADFHRRGLVVRSHEGGVVQLRVGRRTVYPNRIPTVGDKVRVGYSIVRGVYVGYSVTILGYTKKEVEPQKKAIENRPQMPPNLPSGIPGFVGRWEGVWDNIKDFGFTLTIQKINLKLEVAEVTYESKDLRFTREAIVIPGEKPRIEWVINSVVNPEGPFASPSKDYFDIISESIPIYYTFEIQKDGTLKGTFDSQRLSALGTSRVAVMRKVD